MRRSAAFLVLLLAASHAAAQSPADANRAVTLFLHAWLPEIGPVPPPVTESEAALIAVAQAARRGDFQGAQQRLASAGDGAADSRTRYLVPLWSHEIARRRFRFAGGVAPQQLDRGIALIYESPARQAELDKARSIASTMRPPETSQAGAIGKGAGLIDQCIEGSLNFVFSQIGRAVLEKLAPMTDQSCQEYMESVSTVGGLRVLTEPSLTLLRDLVAAHSASRLHDNVAAARERLRAGLAIAEQNHWEQARALWLMALGDASAAPRGSPLSLGYELGSEGTIRTELNSVANTMGLGETEPYESRDLSLDAAAGFYQQARAVNQATHGPIPPSDFALREAFLNYRRGKPAYAEYLRAAGLAREERSSWTEIMASTCASLLGGSRQAFADALAAAVKQGNVGAVLSMAQLAQSWAARASAAGDGIGAIIRLRIAADALAGTGFEASRAEVLGTLAAAYDGLRRNEAAVEASKEALSEWTALLKKVQAAEKQPRIGNDSVVAAVYVRASELGLPIANAWFSLWGGYAKLESEEGLAWTIKKKQTWETALQFFGASGVAASVPAEFMQQIKSEAGSFSSGLSDLGVFRKFQTCPGILNYFKRLQPQIQGGDVEFSVGALLLASACDSTLLGTARTQLERLDIVNTVAASWKSAQGPWNAMAKLRFQQAIQDADRWMTLADYADGGLLLSRWVRGLETTLAPVPGYHTYRPLLSYYKARGLALTGDAAGARELLLSLRAEPYWSHAASSTFRADVARALVDGEVKLGHAEAGLLAAEEARAEQDRTRRLATGIGEGNSEAVELAMLLRQAALEENIDRARVAELEQRARTSTDWKAPDLASLRAGIRALPPDTTALVYFPLRNELAVWRLERNAAPRLIRVPVVADRLLLTARQFRATLASGEAGWEPIAQELYGRLIEPVGPVAHGRTIAISGSDLLGNIPFEMLRPEAGQPLLAEHPMVYLGSIAAVQNPGARQASRGALVVGINGGGLSTPEKEAGMVAARLGTAPLAGPAATLAQVERALPEARYVHFATHGVLDAQNPYRSYLSMYDGRLEAWRLLRDAARAELIVLSACNTKLGPQRILKQVTSDEDSITGLASYAGVRRILASLWGANDEASAVLMDAFYRELAGNPAQPALALQRAKIAAARQGFEPYQYANFVLSVRNPQAIRVFAQP